MGNPTSLTSSGPLAYAAHFPRASPAGVRVLFSPAGPGLEPEL